MEELLPSQWITKCAERLHDRWHTVEPAQLEEVAVDIWKNDYLRSMGPAEAAAFWLTPVWRIEAVASKSKRVRSVPLNDMAVELIANIIERDGLGPDDYLFNSAKTGNHLGHVHKVWDRLRKKAGLPHLRLHDLRHQYASFLVNSGRSLYEVQKILGHSSHSVTERYAHLSSKSLMDAANSASVMIRESMPKAA